jgi:hypothetical protein
VPFLGLRIRATYLQSSYCVQGAYSPTHWFFKKYGFSLITRQITPQILSVCEKDVRIMPPIFPIIAIVAVFVFISTHAAVSPSPKEKSKSPSSDLAKALEEVIQASSKANSQGKKTDF